MEQSQRKPWQDQARLGKKTEAMRWQRVLFLPVVVSFTLSRPITRSPCIHGCPRRVALRTVADGNDSTQPTSRQARGLRPAAVTASVKTLTNSVLSRWLRQLKNPTAAVGACPTDLRVLGLCSFADRFPSPVLQMLVAFAMLRGGAPAHARVSQPPKRDHSQSLYNPDSAKGKYMDGSKKSVQTMKKRQKEKVPPPAAAAATPFQVSVEYIR